MMEQQSAYFINQELIEEMVRLKKQAKLVTDKMGGIWPELQDHEIQQVKDILDLACGPGEWIMGVANAYPHFQLVGIDKSQRMIAYASAQAEAEERLGTFRVMDITQTPLDFPNASFDLVNMRFILAFMKREMWPTLLKECYRLLRPGGILRVTEQESGFANDVVYQRYIDLWGAAWIKAGNAFSYSKSYIGVTVVLKHLMREAGFVNPQHRPISIDLSTGEDGHRALLENLREALKLASPFLLHLGITTQREIDALSLDMAQLIGKPGFAAYWLLQTIWSQKPSNG